MFFWSRRVNENIRTIAENRVYEIIERDARFERSLRLW